MGGTMPRQRALPCRAPAVDPEGSARCDRHRHPDAPASPSPSVAPHCGIRTVQCKRCDREARDALPRTHDRGCRTLAGAARPGATFASIYSARRGTAAEPPSLIGRGSTPHHSGAGRSGLTSKILQSQVTIMLGFRRRISRAFAGYYIEFSDPFGGSAPEVAIPASHSSGRDLCMV